MSPSHCDPRVGFPEDLVVGHADRGVHEGGVRREVCVDRRGVQHPAPLARHRQALRRRVLHAQPRAAALAEEKGVDLILSAIIYASGGKIKASLKARAEELAQEINAAQGAHDQAQNLLDKYEGMIAQLERDGEELLDTYRKQGEEEKARMIEEGEREAERIAKDTQRMIENEFKSMQRQIEHELVEASLTRAEEMISSKLNLTDHNRLTESYLNELEQPTRG